MLTLEITHSADAGQRLDRFCKKYFPAAALGGIYKMLRTGKIKVNGKKKDQTYKLEMGDVLSFWMTDEEMATLRGGIQENVDESSQEKSEGTRQEHVHSIQEALLYEDPYLLVINKPAGLTVHAGDHKTDESNLIDQVQDFLAGEYDSLTFRPALVHRIDRDTSGCILIAKEKSVLEALLVELREHRIEKIYHAIVLGNPPQTSGTIRARLLRVENAHHEAKVRVDDQGQSAITHYRLIGSLTLPGKTPTDSMIQASLLECRIETGRTHQIRVHLASIGCPILGDRAYGDSRINAYARRHLEVSRQLLHARQLTFEHPITKKRLMIETPYPSDFDSLLENYLQRNVRKRLI